MAITPDREDLLKLVQALRREQAQNRTDIQRLWKIVRQRETAPQQVTKAV